MRHLFLSLFVAGVCVASVGATTVLPVDFAVMVHESESIVHGVVTDVRSQMTAERRSIETLVTVTVIERLKGAATRQVVVRVPNGQVGRYRRITVGAPEFAEGDEVVLFLSGRAPLVPMPFGLNQGVYRVTRAPGGAVVTPLVAEGAGRVVRGDPARRPLSIASFAQQVRAAMERP
jgi:hypothetical protein